MRVYASVTAHLIVDLVGYVTGGGAPMSSIGRKGVSAVITELQRLKQEKQERSQKPRRQRSRTRRRDGEVVQRDSSGDN